MATSGKMRVRLGVWVGGRQTSATGDRSLGKILIRKSSHEIQNGKDGITPALFINELELAAAVVCALLQHNTVEPQMLDGNKFGQTRAGSTITFNFRKKIGLGGSIKGNRSRGPDRHRDRLFGVPHSRGHNTRHKSTL